MKKIIALMFVFVMLVGVLGAGFYNVYAQTQGSSSGGSGSVDIMGITNQGMQLLGVLKTAQTAKCMATYGTDSTLCNGPTPKEYITDIVQQQVISALMSKVSQDLPGVGQAFQLWSTFQPLIASGKAKNVDIKINSNGEASGKVELTQGAQQDLTRFIGKDNKIKVEYTGTKYSRDDVTGITTFEPKKGESLTLDGKNKFENIASGKIKLNNKGEITEADFTTDDKGGSYNFNGNIIEAPPNSQVTYKEGTIGRASKITMDVPDGSKLDKLPSFEKDKFGNVQITSKDEGGSFTLPDGTKIKGKLIYSDTIPEGFIPPKETVLFNDKVSVTAGNEPVHLSPVKYEYSSFYPSGDGYIGYGDMNIKIDVPNDVINSAEINLKKGTGASFSFGEGSINVIPWSNNPSLGDISSISDPPYVRIGNQVRDFYGNDITSAPFGSDGKFSYNEFDPLYNTNAYIDYRGLVGNTYQPVAPSEVIAGQGTQNIIMPSTVPTERAVDLVRTLSTPPVPKIKIEDLTPETFSLPINKGSLKAATKALSNFRTSASSSVTVPVNSKNVMGDSSDPGSLVIKAAEQLRGKSGKDIFNIYCPSRDTSSGLNCFTVADSVYNFADVDRELVFATNDIHPGLKKPSNTNIRGPDDLKSGDLLQIYNKNGATGEHNVIFKGWKDQTNKIANVYSFSGGVNDNLITKQIDFNNNPITVIWEPKAR